MVTNYALGPVTDDLCFSVAEDLTYPYNLTASNLVTPFARAVDKLSAISASSKRLIGNFSLHHTRVTTFL